MPSRVSVKDLAERVLDLSVERLISWARIFLASVALLAVYLDSSYSEGVLETTRFVLTAFLCYSCGVLLVTAKRKLKSAEQYAVHATDITGSSVLMYLEDGSASSFFVFFVFVILAAGLRWDWLGAIATAAGLVVVVLIIPLALSPESSLSLEDSNLLPWLFKGGFLLVCGALLAYVGAFRERSRSRFAQLAAWPASAKEPQGKVNELPALGPFLAHVAQVMRVPRVLVIWSQKEEPHRYVALWSKGNLSYSKERSDVFGALVSPTLAETGFWLVDSDVPQTSYGTRWVGSPVSRELRAVFAITSFVTSGFVNDNCSGRVFMLDRPSFSEEDVPFAEIIAARIGAELDHHILRLELEQAAAARERVRLARDLHDGVLQGLAAANIHLRVHAEKVSPEIRDELSAVRKLLAAEAQRIRAFVEDVRGSSIAPTGILELKPMLEKRVASLRQQWACAIELNLDPADIIVPLTAARDIRHIVSEAVSNAVRHGKASRVEIMVRRPEGRVSVQIRDDGNGFENLSGSYDVAELEARGAGPLSLRSRVDEAGGILFLSSSLGGTDITIELPA